jgi:hypothetical protein
MKKLYLIPALLLISTILITSSSAEEKKQTDYYRAKWDPIHFSPAIETATNVQCLSCHLEILNRKVLNQSPAGVATTNMQAWYQTLPTYEGSQDTFHRRHLSTDYTNKIMDMKCNTCHQGDNPRERAVIPPNEQNKQFTLRKSVNPEICLMCHGTSPYKIMGLPFPWQESRKMFQNNCLLCHAGIRTNRHQVNFLKADAIEKAGAENSDVCYGCHGGRAWYRISYPYARNSWKGMAKEIPDWAKDRPTESEPRFRINKITTANKK